MPELKLTACLAPTKAANASSNSPTFGPVVSQLDPSAFHEEFVRSRELLELSLGAEIPDFAYPFGKPADRSLLVEKFLESCGYRSAVTTSQG